MNVKNLKLAIIGLGYVGLPLAVEFGSKRPVIGYDINKKRINEISNFIDSTLEISKKKLKECKGLSFTSSILDLAQCNCYIITVPTPIDRNNKPNLKPLYNATKNIAKILKKNDIVIYESTVYPGLTEEYCAKNLEKFSGLVFNEDFFLGYSPERINPGDKKHTIKDIVKITSGSDNKTANLVDKLYKTIIKAGTIKVSQIKVAEAAKVIENTQRDVNIALINELSLIFNILEIDTEEVLKAASTKWNFNFFKPGLVGGHCIGVDPYYLTYKSQLVGYDPKIILAGRRLNDNMGNHVVLKLINKMTNKKIKINGSKILIMGVAFKENCADIRNSKVFDVIKKLKRRGAKVSTFDPWVSATIKDGKKIGLIDYPKSQNYDAIVICVAHEQFRKMGVKKIKDLGKKNYVLFDLKYIFSVKDSDLRL